MWQLRLEAFIAVVAYGGLITGAVWLFGWQSCLVFAAGVIIGIIGASS
jgi:hypothetical protein